uniref:NADH-ubiquinone oxidoreductase chain 3 n=1 Tax=Jesogammarus hinumensis TaxID=378308 RepID=A0A891ZKK9_9CRUS|nr:NADH dehydrogenase subunit 3 [Jesogammarus hinumensis]QRN71582.1 NADH dehydrogenase subunit 3 [Jesogammarus hinumensis]
MNAITILAFISFCLSALIATLALTLGQKSQKDREKLSPFECGFDPKKKARTPFSLRFFLITVLFIIFDVEIVFLVPLGVTISYAYSYYLTSLTVLITIILILGLLHEWNQGILNWVT